MGIRMNEYTLENEYIKLAFLDYGAIITSLYFKKHNLETVLSYDDINHYLNNDIQLGASCVGPYAGRIENASYTINDKKVELDKNHGNHSIHGGFNNLSNTKFNVEIIENCATLSTTYNDLTIKVVFTLNSDVLKQETFATTKEATLFNPTNHTYFTLGGNCLDYKLNLNTDYMYYLNSESIPRKKVMIENSDFENVNGKDILKNISSSQFNYTKFIDHPFHLKSNIITISNDIYDLSIETNQKFAVVYCGNYLSECDKKINNQTPYDHMGICIETQNVPNCINIENEDSSILYPNEQYYALNQYSVTLKKT